MKPDLLSKLLRYGPILWLASILLSAQVTVIHAEIIASSNRVDWVLGQTVGVPGGIPNRTTIYTTFTSSATAAQINNAIANCPSNQVVKLGAGTFTLSAGLNFGYGKGITLRGSGPSTILKMTTDDPAISIGGWGNESAGTGITAGYSKGSSNLTVSSISGLVVGALVRIDQIIDTNIMWSADGDSVRSVNQMALVKAINGSVVTIWPPLHYGLTPRGNPLMKNYGGLANQADYCGVEDMTIDFTGRTSVWGMLIEMANSCWVKNVRTIKVFNYHIYTFQTLQCEFAKVFIDDSPDYEPNHGGILIGATGVGMPSTAAAVYDCIFNKILPGVEMNGGSSGCIVAYNYFRDPRYSTTAQAVGLSINHSGQNMMNLYEGNISNMIQSDAYFAGSSHNTIFRNWSTGWTETFTNYNSKPIALNKWSIFENVVGNVLGYPTFTPDYQNITLSGYGYDTSTIYQLGYPNGGNGDYTGNRPPSTDRVNARDLNVESTATIHGNWDSKTRAIAWKSSIADHNLPNSFYLPSKPAWFGNLTWPPFNPATGYTNLTFATIPAGYRYINGTDPPSGTPGNQPPVANASAAPLSGAPPLVVNFSSAGSTDPEGTTLTYAWIFGDGTTSTAANPSHTYSTVGNYSAQLTVSDGTNTASSSIIGITVGVLVNQPPVAAASGNPLSGTAPLTVAFSSAGSSDPEGTMLSYSWTFGDSSTSTTANPSHTYSAAGIYTAKLTVSDGTNSTSSANISITVAVLVNQPPVVAASGNPLSGTAPLSVAFSSVGSSDPEGKTLTYSWTFGDSSTSATANPSHTYSVTGTYTAKLTVSDGTNSATSGNISITVAAPLNQPPIVAASASPLSGAPPLTVTFSSAGSSDPEGTTLSYSWAFGDGTTSTAANPSHAYQAVGFYAARLTVSDGVNSASSGDITLTVGNPSNGLVAAYGFEEGAGSSVLDASGSNNTGTINAATWVTTGKFGKALSFNGISALVTVNHSTSLALASAMTLEAWVYPTSLGDWRDVIYKGMNDIYYLMGSTGNGNAPGAGGTFSSGNYNLYGSSVLPLNTWSHLAATYDGTTMRFFVNGAQVASQAKTGALTSSTGNLTIGGDALYGQFWAGRIDEVRIYSRALSAGEIQADMADPVVVKPVSPLNLRLIGAIGQ